MTVLEHNTHIYKYMQEQAQAQGKCMYCRDEDSLDNLRRVCQNCVIYVHEKCAVIHVKVNELKKVKCFTCDKFETCLLGDLTLPCDIFDCIHNNNLEGVRKRLENGAGIDARDSDGWTPLHVACAYSNNLEIIKLLIEKGADVNARTKLGWTPLHNACVYSNNLEIIKLLIEKGADMHARLKESDSTPLSFAKLYDKPSIVNYLESL